MVTFQILCQTMYMTQVAVFMQFFFTTFESIVFNILTLLEFFRSVPFILQRSTQCQAAPQNQ